jgi:hypothetical protein
MQVLEALYFSLLDVKATVGTWVAEHEARKAGEQRNSQCITGITF